MGQMPGSNDGEGGEMEGVSAPYVKPGVAEICTSSSEIRC